MSIITNLMVLANMVTPEPGFIVRPIANLFGHVINFLFNIVYRMTPAHSLGLTIILATIVIRALMLPLNLNMQKSMAKMREIQPELNKIKEKYGNSKDPEIRKKMQAEQQALMAKHGANPLKGCFPMLLTMPIFIGFNFILRQAFLYINRLGDLYYEISEIIISIPNIMNHLVAGGAPGAGANAINVVNLLPAGMQNAGLEAQAMYDRGYSLAVIRERLDDFIWMGCPADVSRVISLFTPENWAWLYTQIPAHYANALMALNERKDAIEHFFGLSMVESASFSWPSAMIPFLVGITMMISMYIGNLRMAGTATDDKAKMQQRIMVIVMPIFIGWITFGMPAGVGLFWIVTQVLQGIQDLVLNKKAGVKFRLPFLKTEAE